MAQNKPELNVDNDPNLIYKDHNEFFRIFFDLRTKSVINLTESVFNPNLIKATYESFYAIVEWTSEYLEANLTEIDNRMVGVATNIRKLSTLEGNKKYQLQLEIIKELRKISRDLAKEHQRHELIPKIKVEEENENKRFWKDETNKAMQQAKKDFYDIIIAN